jgi:dTDP-4-amino-4,6-dideoxygalactose transaminase
MQFNNLGKQWNEIRENVLIEIDALGSRGDYIGGKHIEKFETEFSSHFGSSHSVGVSNGTDALKIALQIFDLSSKDLVIMPANTFIADYLAVRNLPGEKPEVALIDHDTYYNIDVKDLQDFLHLNRKNYEKVIVIAVHLYGHPCDLESLISLSKEYNFEILEDCSQSHGTKHGGTIQIGNSGTISAYSLYPGKNLGAMGDAGIITTGNEEIAKRCRSLRNYGSSVKYHYDEVGNNHRLDTIQAIVLLEKLQNLEKWTEVKTSIAENYFLGINNELVKLPEIADYCERHSYHIFCIEVENRVGFQEHLSKLGIPTIIHYPIPIHKTKIFDHGFCVGSEKTDLSCERIVSLPMHPFLTLEEINQIVDGINSWKG